jgi:DNA-binding NarL/FixJ family response regulator
MSEHFLNALEDSSQNLPKKIVWLIEDNDAYRRTTALLLNECHDLRCEHTFPACEEALARLSHERGPDVFLVDVALPGMSGIEGIKRIKAIRADSLAVVLTVFGDDDRIFRAICAGASGYLLKTAQFDEIIGSVRQVLEGGAPMSAPVARRVLEIFSRYAPKENNYALTEKEKAVLELLARDFGKKQIAAELGISFHTVDAHLRHIYKKLHVHSSAGAVAKALKERLL